MSSGGWHQPQRKACCAIGGWLHTCRQWRARALAGASVNTLTLASELAPGWLAARRSAAGWLAAGKSAAGWWAAGGWGAGGWAAGGLAAGWLAAGKVGAGWLAAGKLAVGKLRGSARVKVKE